jgi:hypothetical protein
MPVLCSGLNPARAAARNTWGLYIESSLLRLLSENRSVWASAMEYSPSVNATWGYEIDGKCRPNRRCARNECDSRNSWSGDIRNNVALTVNAAVPRDRGAAGLLIRPSGARRAPRCTYQPGDWSGQTCKRDGANVSTASCLYVRSSITGACKTPIPF